MILAAVLLLVALGLAGLWLGIAAWLWLSLYYVLRPNGWRTVPGVVTESRIVDNRQTMLRVRGYHYRVRYTFSVGDEDYEDTRVRFGDFRYLTRRRAERMVARYPVGTAVQVYYNAEFKPWRVGEDEAMPIATLVPGLNVECLYPVIVFLSVSTLEIWCVWAIVDRVRALL